LCLTHRREQHGFVSRIEERIDEHLATVAKLKGAAGDIAACADLVIEALRAGHRLYVLGNGGSAADAQHIAAELIGRFKHAGKPALPATALTTDTSCLTALGNDFGFEQIFARQVEALVSPGDVVWALSVSGRSANVLAAVERARRRGARIIGFTGGGGDVLRQRCDACVTVDHSDSDRVQEGHQLAYHIVCELIEREFVGGKNAAGSESRVPSSGS
jgi:D-sedoheptulose 7-phosphate isomerase